MQEAFSFALEEKSRRNKLWIGEEKLFTAAPPQ